VSPLLSGACRRIGNLAKPNLEITSNCKFNPHQRFDRQIRRSLQDLVHVGAAYIQSPGEFGFGDAGFLHRIIDLLGKLEFCGIDLEIEFRSCDSRGVPERDIDNSVGRIPTDTGSTRFPVPEGDEGKNGISCVPVRDDVRIEKQIVGILPTLLSMSLSGTETRRETRSWSQLVAQFRTGMSRYAKLKPEFTSQSRPNPHQRFDRQIRRSLQDLVHVGAADTKAAGEFGFGDAGFLHRIIDLLGKLEFCGIDLEIELRFGRREHFSKFLYYFSHFVEIQIPYLGSVASKAIFETDARDQIGIFDLGFGQ